MVDVDQSRTQQVPTANLPTLGNALLADNIQSLFAVDDLVVWMLRDETIDGGHDAFEARLIIMHANQAARLK